MRHFTPGVLPDEETRRLAATRIVQTLDVAERDAAARKITADEAVEHVRRSRM